MTVYESDIPGVGRKFEVELDDGSRAVVLVHHDGRREVFRRPTGEADSTKLFDLTARQAGVLASVLQGTNYETVDVSALEVPLGESIIEWIEIGDGSALAGRTLGESNVRGETGASIIAVQRGEETVANPDTGFEIRSGDILVALGGRGEQAALQDLA